MSFKQSMKHCLNPNSFGWSLLWLAVPIINVLSSFLVLGYWARLVQSCRLKKYDATYDEYGFLFVKGLFSSVILLIYVVPGLIVLRWSRIGYAVILLGLLFGWAGFVKFAETERFMSAFSLLAFGLLASLRFWIGLFVSGVVSVIAAVALGAIAVLLQSSIVVPIIALAIWIVLTGTVLAALSGHAEN